MRINICDNLYYKDDLYDNWCDSHNWYRSKDSFMSNFPKDFEFDFWKKGENTLSIFITKGIYKVDEIESDVKIAIPSDLRHFHGPIYDFIEENIDKFDRVITYDERLISLHPEKCFPSPAMKPWIWPKENQKIYKKSKLCSMIASKKIMIPGHIFRVEILNDLYKMNFDVDCYGEGHNPLPEDQGKINGLKDYAFSIAMENHRSNYYFSEKLLDVILTGGIPIYWGCKSISNYFNMDGFILFETKEELYDILKNLTIDDYRSRIEAVKENFEICKNKYIDNFHYFLKEGTEWI